MTFLASNNDAVGLMGQGRTSESIALLNRALHHLKEQPSQEDESMTDQAQHLTSVPVLACDTFLMSTENLFSLFPSAFVPDQQSSECTNMVVLLYNLGLAHHLQALQTQDFGYASLHKILRFYELALNAANVGWRDLECDLHKTVLLALTNNMGHAHSLMNNFTHARECLHLMLSLMKNTQGPGSVLPEDYRVFFDSVYIYWHGTPLANSPAA